jgi:DNA-binding MarR family transcriptional regulator
MGKVLQERIKQATFESSAQEVVLNLLVSSGYIRSKLDRACVLHGLTIGQYNVLRILRGAHPNGYPRCDIIDRMLEPAPDVTRLIDRLVKDGFVSREQSVDDRRLSIATITEKGLIVLQQMQASIIAVMEDATQRFSEGEAAQFSLLCEKIYE